MDLKKLKCSTEKKEESKIRQSAEKVKQVYLVAFIDSNTCWDYKIKDSKPL